MKILIVSDIHGSLPALEKVLNYYVQHQCEQLCLLGDILNYGPRNGLPEGLNPQAIAEHLNARAASIVAVRGNCDSEVDQMLLHFPIMADYALVCDGKHRLFLTHGHIYHEEKLPPLSAADFFFYGHTHLQHLTPSDGVGPTICNTGSPTFPKNGNLPTFAVYEDGQIDILDLEGNLVASSKV